METPLARWIAGRPAISARAAIRAGGGEEVPNGRNFLGRRWAPKQRLGIVAGFGLALALRTHAAPDFARDVRPILERSCFGCHGPEKQKHGYRLDVRDRAMRRGESGEAAIVPHHAAASPLIRYISSTDDERVMPPRKSDAPRLSAVEIQMLREWIDAGPAWPDELAGHENTPTHWSLRPLIKPAVPGTESNPIDAFIHAQLATHRLVPSPAADRRTLIRRLSYDLTGLPPTAEEVAAFAVDPDPQAYEKWVSRLLNSPRYGERWARHWLDTIHFADSHGYEHDIGRDHAWRFRDYVIGAFNRDTPWPRFIREQLAADVFYPDETQLTAALGFLGAGTFDLSTYSTGPVTFDYLDRDDLVTQTLSAFVSTTANCARCHDHKFDPISQEDYYALQAVFAGILKGDVAYDEAPTVARERRRWSLLVQASDKKDPASLFAAENQSLVDAWIARQGVPVRWQTLEAETYLSTEGSTLTRRAGGSYYSGGPRPEWDTYILTASPALTQLTAVRLELLPDDSLPMHGPGRNENGNLHLSELELRFFPRDGTNSQTIKFRRATADFNQADWGVEKAIDGDLKTAWGIYPAVGLPHRAVFELAEPQAIPAGSRVVLSLKQAHGSGHLIGAFRLAVTDDEATRASVLPLEVEAALAVPAAERSGAHRLALAAHAVRTTATEALAQLPAQAVVYAAAASVRLIDNAGPGSPKSLAEPKVVHLLNRGDFDKPRAVVPPGALSALTHLPARFALKDARNEGARRAALADWLAHSDNILTWRSVVNRVWHYHFGRGLCDTPSDLGKMGGTPLHPELMDWLAVWFRDEARGSLKELHRLIVTSTTYQQASQYRPDGGSLDSDNRWLWRQNRHRLDADSYRDFTLAASGALDLTMGGPSIKHFKQGPGPQLTPALDYTGYDWAKPEAARRSIYRNVWRGIADPFMEALDFPDLGLLSPVRGFSASSLQALTLYNNDFVLHHSGVLAKRVESEASTLENQVSLAVQRVWLRESTAGEQRDFTKFARQAGLPALCRLLLNSNEYLFIE